MNKATKVITTKNRAIVIIKNKPINIKAIQYLGKYSQNKGLLDETIKMFKSIQESINKYINQNPEITTTQQKQQKLKTLEKTNKQARKREIKDIKIKNTIIFIKTKTSELKQEILLNKQKILKEINKKYKWATNIK